MGALSGVRVLDMSRILTGPFCTMMLGDLGARVVKVESPGGDDTRQWGPPFVNGVSTYFLSINRNKESIVLNLKHPEGREALLRLAKESDVVVENFRPGTADRLGVGYDDLKAVNPGIIYCSVSGFGQDGPYQDKPGYDVLAQAMGGMMATTGLPGGEPVKAGMSIADIGAGMYAAFAILAALRHRDKTGEGQRIDTSLLETMLSWHTYHATAYLATGEVPGPLGSAHPTIVPYQALRCADGHVIVAVGNENLWQRFCRAARLEHLADDPRFDVNAQRVTNRQELIPLIEERFADESVEYWTRTMEEAGVPAGPILNMDQIYADPHVLSRDMLIEVDHPEAGTVKMTGIPMKFSATPGRVQLPPPALGQHTEEVLGSLGYTEGEIAAMREAGTI